MSLWILSLLLSGSGVATLIPILPRQNDGLLVGNTSVLPPGWSPNSNCLADCTSNDDSPLPVEFMLGPSFFDTVGLTIESCVAFCNQQGWRLAGLKGTECRCANIFNPESCFESDQNECPSPNEGSVSCPGNSLESCGRPDGTPSLFNIFFNEVSQFSCSGNVWPGGAALTAPRQWRFSYFYNDSITGRALPHNAVDLKVPLPRGNLTTVACTTACGNAGFTLAGVEYADECYCGNAIQNNAHPISNCAFLNVFPTMLMKCKGNENEFCGGPNIVSVYTLPGTGLVPILPFDPELDDFCTGTDCEGHT